MPRLVARILLLTLGVLFASTAGVLIKGISINGGAVVVYRLVVAAALTLPLFLRELRASSIPYGWREVSWSVIPGILFAAHLITFTFGVRLTRVVNASLIINMTPAVMPFFLWAVFHERINTAELRGTLVTLAGLAVLSVSRLRLSGPALWGDLLCVLSMLTLAAYMAYGRRNGARLSLWLYMAPLYLVAALASGLFALLFGGPFEPLNLRDALLIFTLGVVPTIAGHTLINNALRHLRGQVVSIASLSQIVFAAVMGYLFYREIPEPALYPSAALIVAGVVITLVSANRRHPLPPNSPLSGPRL